MFFFRKKNEKKEIRKTKSGISLVKDYDARPYYDLKYDLSYAKNEILVDNEDVIIACRVFKKTLLKYMVIHNFEKSKEYSLSNEKLLEYAKILPSLRYIKLEDFEIKKEVRNYILKECNDSLIEYAFVNAKASKDYYEQYYFYNENGSKLEIYRRLKDFDTLVVEANTSLFFDMACTDEEEA